MGDKMIIVNNGDKMDERKYDYVQNSWQCVYIDKLLTKRVIMSNMKLHRKLDNIDRPLTGKHILYSC